MTQNEEEKKRKTLNIKAKSKKCLDIVMCTVDVTMLKVNNIAFFQDQINSNKLSRNSEENSITLCAEETSMFINLSKKKMPSYVPQGEQCYLLNYPGTKVDVKKLSRYTVSQQLPGKVRDGDLDQLESLGFHLNRELTQNELYILSGPDGDAKNNLIEDLLHEGFDNNPEWEENPRKIPTFPLTNEGVLDMAPVSRGTVVVDKETYMSNVMSNGDGRNANFELSYVALAKQRGCEPDDVMNWMKDNGYTWHEIDDKATLQKVPSHLHACINHAGAVALVQDKFDTYDKSLQFRVATSALPNALKIQQKQQKKVSKAKKKKELADKGTDEKAKKDAAKKLRDAERDLAKTEYRISLMKQTGAESYSGAGMDDKQEVEI